MKVIDNRKTGKKVQFEDLPIGEGYLDENDFLCIKTSHHDGSENCICFTNGSWGADYQSDTDWVTPIALTYTVEG